MYLFINSSQNPILATLSVYWEHYYYIIYVLRHSDNPLIIRKHPLSKDHGG